MTLNWGGGEGETLETIVPKTVHFVEKKGCRNLDIPSQNQNDYAPLD